MMDGKKVSVVFDLSDAMDRDLLEMLVLCKEGDKPKFARVFARIWDHLEERAIQQNAAPDSSAPVIQADLSAPAARQRVLHLAEYAAKKRGKPKP